MEEAVSRCGGCGRCFADHRNPAEFGSGKLGPGYGCVADGTPSRSNATTMGVGTNLEFGIVWQDRTHRRCRSATQGHSTFFQSSQVVCHPVLMHLTTQGHERIKCKQEQDSCENLQEHVLTGRGLLASSVLFDQLQDSRHLLIQLTVLVGRGCLSLGPSREVFRDTRNRSRLTNLSQLHLLIGILLGDGKALGQGLHKVLETRLGLALSVNRGTSGVLRSLSFGSPFLKSSPLDFFQGRKLDRHPLVFGSLEKCGESSNAYKHGVDTHRIGGGLACLLLVARSEDCQGHLPHRHRTLRGPPCRRLVGQAAVGGSCHHCCHLLREVLVGGVARELRYP